MSEWTSGPWLIDTGHRGWFTIVARTGKPYGEPQFIELGRFALEANARLSIAAPDMLAFLKRIPDGSIYSEEINALINKAEQ